MLGIPEQGNPGLIISSFPSLFSPSLLSTISFVTGMIIVGGRAIAIPSSSAT